METRKIMQKKINTLVFYLDEKYGQGEWGTIPKVDKDPKVVEFHKWLKKQGTTYRRRNLEHVYKKMTNEEIDEYVIKRYYEEGVSPYEIGKVLEYDNPSSVYHRLERISDKRGLPAPNHRKKINSDITSEELERRIRNLETYYQISQATDDEENEIIRAVNFFKLKKLYNSLKKFRNGYVLVYPDGHVKRFDTRPEVAKEAHVTIKVVQRYQNTEEKYSGYLFYKAAYYFRKVGLK